MDNFHNLSFFDIYEKNALYNGSNTAIYDGDCENGYGAITYSDLFQKTARLANSLKRLNLPSKSRIAILCKNHPLFFHLFGAASALNLTLVLINRRLSSDEVSHIIEDTTPSIIFADEQMADQAKNLCNTFSCLEHNFVVNENNEQFLNLYDDTPLEIQTPCGQDDPFIIIHTAAMLGKPRGAVLSQNNIILSNQQIIQAFDLNETKAYLNILPLFHIMGVNLGLGMLQAGGKNVIQ